ncbi:MAG: hypothetical protein ABL865_05995 [Candidatus Nitrotoga sp.]
MNRVADKKWMIARRATLVVVILQYQGAQHSECLFCRNPQGHWHCGRSAASGSWRRE